MSDSKIIFVDVDETIWHYGKKRTGAVDYSTAIPY